MPGLRSPWGHSPAWHCRVLGTQAWAEVLGWVKGGCPREVSTLRTGAWQKASWELAGSQPE